MENWTELLDPALAAKIIAVLTLLSAIRGILSSFFKADNKAVAWISKILDVIGYNPKH